MFETVLTDSTKWARHFNAIREATKATGHQPAYVVVNANTNNDGDRTDWRRFRLAFATTLLTEAYFSFDYGDKWHQQTWWYDEYGVNLGMPKGDAYQIVKHVGATNATGVWRRDFDGGVALVNSAPVSYAVDLKGAYRKIAGTQDKDTNNGVLVTSLTVPAHDGVVLKNELAPVQAVPDRPILTYLPLPLRAPRMPSQAFVGGARITIRDAETGIAAVTNTHTHAQLPQGLFGLVHDMEGDGGEEVVIWDKGVLSLSRNGRRQWAMRPYDQHWSGMVSMAAGDLDGDGISEIALAAGFGGGPHIRIVNANGTLKTTGFFADDKRKRNGAFVAIGDTDGDRIEEIIVGSGKGETPSIKIFSLFGENKSQIKVRSVSAAIGVRVATYLSGGVTKVGVY
jgi:hypothetical protein